MQTESLTYIQQQNDNRKLWGSHDTEQSIAAYILEEFGEYTEQKQECFVTDDVTALALEAGDVFYLCDKYRLAYGDLPSRLKAIEDSVISDCLELGLEPDDCKMAKIIRNSMKYPDHIMSNGRNYKTATFVCKESWKAMGGDVAWSNSYLDYLAHIGDDEDV